MTSNVLTFIRNISFVAKERLCFINVTITLFMSIAVSYQVHRWSGGAIFSSRLLTLLLFIFSLLLFSLVLWPWAKLKLDKSREYKWIYVSLFSICLTCSIWLGRSGFSGDINIHKQFALQLLNGNTEGHFFYKEAPGFYPPVSHAALAIFANLTGLSMHHSFLAVSVIVAFWVPLFSYTLAKQLNFSPRMSLFFCMLISLYGGLGHTRWGMFHLYLPAVQLSMPFISRNMSLLLFLAFLVICLRMCNSPSISSSYVIFVNIGVLAGLLGLIHPQGFFMSGLLIVTTYAFFLFRQPFSNKTALLFTISIIITAVIAGFHYVPSLISLKNYGGLIHVVRVKEVFPTSLYLYGPLPLLSLVAFSRRKYIEGWMLPSLVVLFTAVLGRLVLSQIISVDKWTIFRIYPSGPYIFIFLGLFATKGCEKLSGLRKLRIPTVGLMILIILAGYWSAFNYLNSWKRIKIRKVISQFETDSIFPQKGIERLRLQINDPRKTVMVPPNIAYAVACEAGLHIPYIERPRIFFKTFFDETFSQQERLKMVTDFYCDLESGVIRTDILSSFQTDIFLASQNNLTEHHKKLENLLSLEIKNQSWFVYRVTY